MRLKEKDGKPVLESNIYALLKDFRAGIITTETLGRAFEPEECFENTDGTPITFDTDFFGDHRGLSALPGPFAKAQESYSF